MGILLVDVGGACLSCRQALEPAPKIIPAICTPPLCGRFCPNSVAVARYGALIRTKSPTNCDAHLAESLFQTCSNSNNNKPSQKSFEYWKQHLLPFLHSQTLRIEYNPFWLHRQFQYRAGFYHFHQFYSLPEQIP